MELKVTATCGTILLSMFIEDYSCMLYYITLFTFQTNSLYGSIRIIEYYSGLQYYSWHYPCYNDFYSYALSTFIDNYLYVGIIHAHGKIIVPNN